MDNHVHLLVTLPETGALSTMMQKLGRGYVGQFNANHRRTGTLWEGRYKACLVDTETYVLRCYRDIDLNPVRARMTDDPASHPWSSAPSHYGLQDTPWLTPYPTYIGLAPSAEARTDAYREVLREVLSDDDLAPIRIYLKQQRALGRDAFRAMVEAKARRFAGIRPAHPPSRSR